VCYLVHTLSVFFIGKKIFFFIAVYIAILVQCNLPRKSNMTYFHLLLSCYSLFQVPVRNLQAKILLEER